jgi:hypothetical protein
VDSKPTTEPDVPIGTPNLQFTRAPVASLPDAVPMSKRLTAPVQRDRIVVIGRRQSGKTVYLATLYEALWRSTDGLTGKALTGLAHKHLMEAHAALRRGEWPPATLGSARVELEIAYKGRKHLLVTLDFAGEVFARAFLHDAQQSPDVVQLLEHIDRAAAVILLVDPSVGFGSDHEAAMEEDFGLAQAVERIRNWPGGDTVPIVMVFTKADIYGGLVNQSGSDGSEIVRHHFPSLVRLLGKIPVCHVSAVQTVRNDDGKMLPSKNSKAMNIDKPLKYCLRAMTNAEEVKLQEIASIVKRRQENADWERSQKKEQNLVVTLVAVVGGIIVVGVAIALYIIYR